MRPTLPTSGIKGLFPLVRALAPTSISPPFTQASLRGLRLAIDATLLTQKIHFADDPHPSRHLIGFYRLINSLRENGASPIMIFDHPSKRLALKDREHDKRKKKRQLDRMRNKLETQRKARLRTLERMLDTLRRFTPDERRQVGALLEAWQRQRQAKAQAQAQHAEPSASLSAPDPEPEEELVDRLAAEYLAMRDIPDSEARRPELWHLVRKIALSPLADSPVAASSSPLPSSSQQKQQQPRQQEGEDAGAQDPDELCSTNLDVLEQLGQRAADDTAQTSSGDGGAADLHGYGTAEELYDLAGDDNLVSLERQPISASTVPGAAPHEADWQQILEDLTSRPFALALWIHRSRRQFERSVEQMGEFQSKGQKELTKIEQKLYDSVVSSLVQAPAATAAELAPRKTSVAPTALADQPTDAAPDATSGTDEALRAIERDTAAAVEQLASEAAATEAPPLPSRPTLPPSVSPLRTLNRDLSKTYARSATPLPATIYADCAHLCTLMSVPVFWTGDGTRSGGGKVHEAEAYASSLVKAGYADVVASEDSDVLLYDTPLLRGLVGGIRPSHPASAGAGGGGGLGKKMEMVDGSRVRRGLFKYESLQSFYQRAAREARESARSEPAADAGGKAKRSSRSKAKSKSKSLLLSPTASKPSEASSESLQLDLPPPSPAGETVLLRRDEYEKMTRSMMIDFALLCGTDFNRTIPGIGPKTALRLILQHGSIAAILQKEAKKFQPPDGLSIKEYEAELRHARMVFLNPPKVRAAARSVFASAKNGRRTQGRGRRGSASALSPVAAASMTEGGADPFWKQRFFEDEEAPVIQEPASDGMQATQPEASVGADAEVASPSSTAEISLEAAVDAVQTDAGSGQTHASDTTAAATGEATSSDAIVCGTLESLAAPTTPYNRQAVLDYLQEKGVFGSTTRPAAVWPQSGDDDSWRDVMDLELGIDTRSRRRSELEDEADDPEASLAAHWSGSAGDGELVMESERRLMGVDFFGEKQAGTACWSPEMESRIRSRTTISEVRG
ncbi:hypothetical protein ACQY0O_003302 [Thecaphora frezii]